VNVNLLLPAGKREDTVRKNIALNFLLAPSAALALFALAALASAGAAPQRNVILSTTTSTQDTGLLDALVPSFEKQTGYSVKTISVGTGQALALAAKGDADVALVHAPALEKQYVAEGKLLHRRLVMYNDFVIIGPKEDPARVASVKKAVEALKLIEKAGARFVSRGDNSGTHILEKTLWKQAGIETKGAWYIESGQGMGATLGIANERNAYTLADRATYLAFTKRVALAVLLEGDKPLLNVYSVMEVNPAAGPRINAAGAKAFADFMVAPAAQAAIQSFGLEKFGRPLFVPVAGMKEEDLGE
jgi:tungstate transport system substrate-binding protein